VRLSRFQHDRPAPNCQHLVGNGVVEQMHAAQVFLAASMPLRIADALPLALPTPTRPRGPTDRQPPQTEKLCSCRLDHLGYAMIATTFPQLSDCESTV